MTIPHHSSLAANFIFVKVHFFRIRFFLCTGLSELLGCYSLAQPSMGMPGFIQWMYHNSIIQGQARSLFTLVTIPSLYPPLLWVPLISVHCTSAASRWLSLSALLAVNVLILD